MCFAAPRANHSAVTLLGFPRGSLQRLADFLERVKDTLDKFKSYITGQKNYDGNLDSTYFVLSTRDRPDPILPVPGRSRVVG